MPSIRNLIKKYFSNFVWFYRYLGNKIFIAFALSIAVSFLDGLGLTMFFPLLQVVGDAGPIEAGDMGQLAWVVQAIEGVGIPMTILSVLIVMVVFFVLKGLAVYARQVYQVFLLQSFIRKIRLNLLNHLNQMSFKKFVSSDVGRIQNTMTGEVSKVSLAFTTYMGTFQQGVMVLVYMAFAFMADFRFALLVSVGGAVINFLYRFIYTRTKDASRKLTQYGSKFQGELIQHIAHFKYLKATGSVHDYSKKMETSIKQIEDSRRRIGMLNAISTGAREPMLVFVVAIIIFIQIKYFHGEMGTIIISMLFFYRALTSIMGLQESWNGFMANSGSLENLQLFQEELSRHREKDGKEEFTQFEKEIELNQVKFNYGNTEILKNIELKIRKNQSIAFVGESGSGKTTLVNLICGLLPESEGSIKVDGSPMKAIRKETYQKRIGYVSQDAVVFNDTIYNNVTFFAAKTAENLARFEKAIQQAALGEFISQLEKGKETLLGNNGINLSGGQKQRISIARELYKDIDILILDEATSALDSETEKAIQESIEALQGQYTLVMIAHRLATIRNADEIVFMDAGKIIAKDSFENLMQKEERFKKMVELQEL